MASKDAANKSNVEANHCPTAVLELSIFSHVFSENDDIAQINRANHSSGPNKGRVFKKQILLDQKKIAISIYFIQKMLSIGKKLMNYFQPENIINYLKKRKMIVNQLVI